MEGCNGDGIIWSFKEMAGTNRNSAGQEPNVSLSKSLVFTLFTWRRCKHMPDGFHDFWLEGLEHMWFQFVFWYSRLRTAAKYKWSPCRGPEITLLFHVVSRNLHWATARNTFNSRSRIFSIFHHLRVCQVLAATGYQIRTVAVIDLCTTRPPPPAQILFISDLIQEV